MTEQERQDRDADISQEISADAVLALKDALSEWLDKVKLGSYGIGRDVDNVAYYATGAVLGGDCDREIDDLEQSFKSLIFEAIQTARSEFEHG